MIGFKIHWRPLLFTQPAMVVATTLAGNAIGFLAIVISSILLTLSGSWDADNTPLIYNLVISGLVVGFMVIFFGLPFSLCLVTVITLTTSRINILHLLVTTGVCINLLASVVEGDRFYPGVPLVLYITATAMSTSLLMMYCQKPKLPTLKTSFVND